PSLHPIAAAAILGTTPRVIPRLPAQRAGYRLRHPGVQRHALLGGSPLSLSLHLVDQSQSHPSDVTAGVTKRAGTGLKGQRLLVSRSARPGFSGVASGMATVAGRRAHRDPYIPAVET